MAPVISVRITRTCMDRKLNPSANWQVIFKTWEFKDYCRETVDADTSLEDVVLWAIDQCHKHDLGGAEIQRF